LARGARASLQALGRQRQELLDHGLLLHRVDEARVDDVERADLALREGVDLHLDRADQRSMCGRRRRRDVRDDLAAEALQEAEALVADRR
jgi:hypothetical protein